MLRRALAVVLAVMVAACAGAAQAAEEMVLERQGYWSVGRGKADSRHCLASVPTRTKALFMINASGAMVGLSVMTEGPQRRGKKGVLETDTHVFQFIPDYNDSGDFLMLEHTVSERVLAALRLARGVKIKVDGRTVLDIGLEDTGAEAALDAVLACGKGQAGWWGEGVDQALLAADDPPGVLNAEGYWRLSVDHEDGRCVAISVLGDGGAFMLSATGDGVSFGAVSSRALKPGRKGAFETDAWSFDFEPSYDDGYLYLDDVLNNRALAALRLASRFRIAVDGRTVLAMNLEGTGVDGVLDGLADCVAGKSGWWGKGLSASAAPASRPRSTPEGRSQNTTPGGSGRGDGGGGSGSAFFITADGFAVTAAHVVAQCREVESPRWGRVRLVAVDRPADLAILKLESASGQSLALRGRGPRLGEPLSVGGFPLGGLLGGGLKITTGVVAGLSGPQGDRGLFQLSAPIQPGNSGGPVVDATGALIGVTAAKLDEVRLVSETGTFPQNVNFAAPVTILQAFLDENGIAYRVAPTAASAAPATLVNVTFPVVCKP